MKFINILILFTLVSCSMAKYAISNLDWIIARQLNNRFDLYHNQKNELDKDLNIFLSRQTQKIPRIEEIIEKINQTIQRNPREITIETVENFRDDFYQLYIEIAGDFNINILSKYLVQLNKDQQLHFANFNSKNNLEFEQKLQDKNDSNFTERLEYFFGEFNLEQKKIILQNLNDIRAIEIIRHNRRKNLQSDLYRLLSSSGSEKAEMIQKRLHHFVRKEDTKEELILEINKHQKKIDKMLLEILLNINSKQQKFIKKRFEFIKSLLDAYKKNFSSIE